MSYSHKQQFLIAIDPSLTCSGWALFALSDGIPLAMGLLAPPGPSLSLPQRLSVLQKSVAELFAQLRLSQGDVLVCEGPAPLVLNPSSALKVEHVRSMFETLARERGVSVPGRINPRTLHTELLGMSGRQLSRQTVKASARIVAHNLYGSALSKLPVYMAGSVPRGINRQLSQDAIDALLIGTLAVAKVRFALSSGGVLEEAFSVKHERLRNFRRYNRLPRTGRKTPSSSRNSF